MAAGQLGMYGGGYQSTRPSLSQVARAQPVPASSAGGYNQDQDPGFFGTGVYRPDPGAFQSRTLDMYGNQAQSGAFDAARRGAPTLDTSQQAQFRDGQSQLAGILMAQAMGRGPSAAQAQLQQATDRNMAQAYALSAANPNNGAAARNIAYQRGAIQQQSNADASQLRAQEQLGAQNQLGQVLAGARGQDLGLASEQAGLRQTQNAQNDEMVRYYMSMGMTAAQAQMQAQMALEQLRASSFAAAAGHQLGAQITGGLLSAGGAALGAYAARP